MTPWAAVRWRLAWVLAVALPTVVACAPSGVPDVGCVEGGFQPEAAVATGVCGLEVLTCLCSCPAVGSLSSCVPSAVGVDGGATDSGGTSCGSCVQNARSACCPDELQAFETCQRQANDPDAGADASCAGSNQCVAQRCAPSVGALNACLAAGSLGAGAGGMACVAALRECFGSWPLACMPGPDSGESDGALDGPD